MVSVSHFVSIALFLLSALLFKNMAKKDKARYTYGALVLCYLFTFSFYLIADYFTGEGINEATFYNIRYGFQGAGPLEYSKEQTRFLMQFPAQTSWRESLWTGSGRHLMAGTR